MPIYENTTLHMSEEKTNFWLRQYTLISVLVGVELSLKSQMQYSRCLILKTPVSNAGIGRESIQSKVY